MKFFILGSHPELSKAEIESVLGRSCPAPQKQVLFVDDASLDAVLLQQQLAGTIKIGRVIGEAESYIEENAATLIASLASGAGGKNKISFGISVYDIGAEKKTESIRRRQGYGGQVAHDRDDLGKSVKKILKEAGRPVRYVSSKEAELSSVIVQENDLLASGGEYCLFVDKDKIIVGKTEAVQDFKAWSVRDFGRPARDSKSGMLPPKLARMMINLSGAKTDETLLDPFCGSGTVLMEADLLGFEHVIGSDISAKAIADTKKNHAWLETYFETNKSILENLFVSPAESLDSVLPLANGELEGVCLVDAIVTEVYLGHPRTKPATEKEIQKTTQELLPIYESSFQTLRKLIKPGGTAVVAFPAFVMVDGSVHHLDLKSMLKRVGWTIVDSFLYKRDNQFVGRDILRLKP